MSYELPTPVQWALNRLISSGFEAYAVGGCVRDMLLAQTPHDWDVCTSAAPDEVIESFANVNVRVVATGIKHGTVTAILSGQPVEITTYRVDGGYADHRHPDKVRFTASLREDLARRDFTINAMAFRPDTGIIDFFEGQKDLQARLIRCVGDPDARFTEDALRMLRALRFASRLDFSIEEGTEDALLRHKDELRFVAVERVLAELSGMDFARIDAAHLPVLQVVLPELTSIRVRSDLPPDPAIRLGALLRGLDAKAILKRLHASTALMERVAVLAARADTPVPPDDVDIKKLLREIGPEAAAQLFVIQNNMEALRALEGIQRRGDAYSIKQLDINGRDLGRMGLAGKEVGRMLEALLEKVITGELPNEKYKLGKAVGIVTALLEEKK